MKCSNIKFCLHIKVYSLLIAFHKKRTRKLFPPFANPFHSEGIVVQTVFIIHLYRSSVFRRTVLSPCWSRNINCRKLFIDVYLLIPHQLFKNIPSIFMVFPYHYFKYFVGKELDAIGCCRHINWVEQMIGLIESCFAQVDSLINFCNRLLSYLNQMVQMVSWW